MIYHFTHATNHDYLSVPFPLSPLLTGLPVGAVVSVTITALNDAGESDPSNPAQGTVP